MAIKITGIGKVVTAIVRKRSEAELTKLLPKFKRNLDSRAQYWRTTIRQKLSVMAPKPWGPNTPRNITKWPKMRTGMLRDSILTPKIRWTARSVKWRASHGNTTVRFSAFNFFGVRPNSRGNDISEYLNTMQDYDKDGKHTGVKPFAGWKTRAMREFYSLIEDRRAYR